MIHDNHSSEKTKIAIFKAFKTLKIAELLKKSGIRKSTGISCYQVFQFLILLVFQGKNLYRFLDSKRAEVANSKNTYYRFLNCSTYNWRRFSLSLASRVIISLKKLTNANRVNVLILDDSIYTRNRSKNVELLAKVYDHASHKFQTGFTMLTLGWSDGFNFIPVDFAMISSSNEANQLVKTNEAIDK